jgi:hypothetical protein
VVDVQLIIDLVEPGKGRRRCERRATLPGVPVRGDSIDVARMLALRVNFVRWNALNGTVMIFLGAGDTELAGITRHDDYETELAQYHVDGLAEAGWDIGELE